MDTIYGKLVRDSNDWEGQEKLDIWVAMEQAYGTKTTLWQYLSKLLNITTENKFQAIQIFKQAKDDEMVRELFKSLISKFKTTKSLDKERNLSFPFR